MKNTGITREVDHMGRIVLPIELRRNLGIAEGTELEISVENGSVVLTAVARPLTAVARPLTLEELEGMTGKPVFCRRGDNPGEWEISVGIIYEKDVFFLVTKEKRYYGGNEFDFYNCEVLG